jgi:hypothetical protein
LVAGAVVAVGNARAVEKTIMRSRTHGFMGASRAYVKVAVPADAFPTPPPTYPTALLDSEWEWSAAYTDYDPEYEYEERARGFHGPYPDPSALMWGRDEQIMRSITFWWDDYRQHDDADQETVDAYAAWELWHWQTCYTYDLDGPRWLQALRDAGNHCKTVDTHRLSPDGDVVFIFGNKWFYIYEKEGLAAALRRAMDSAPFPVRPKPAFPQQTFRARSAWPGMKKRKAFR